MHRSLDPSRVGNRAARYIKPSVKSGSHFALHETAVIVRFYSFLIVIFATVSAAPFIASATIVALADCGPLASCRVIRERVHESAWGATHVPHHRKTNG